MRIYTHLKLHRYIAIILMALILFAMTFVVVSSEAKYVYPGGEYTEVYTTPLTQEFEVGHWSRGSISILSGIPQNTLYVQTRAFNNDSFNSPPGWQLKDWKAASGNNVVFVQTAKVYASGYYQGWPYPGQYGCAIFSCYATSYQLINAYGQNYSYYTSNDGAHSTSQCFGTPGC